MHALRDSDTIIRDEPLAVFEREAGRRDCLPGFFLRGEVEVQGEEEGERFGGLRHAVGGADGGVEAGVGGAQRVVAGFVEGALEFAQGHAIHGIEELLVEVVDPEFVEVAEDDVGRAVRDDVRPVVEGLVVVALQLRAAGFHLDEHALGSQQIGEFLAALAKEGRFQTARPGDEFELCGAGLFRDAELEGRARLHHSLVAESAEETLQKSLRLALFITMKGACEGGEFFEGGAQFCRGHGRRMRGATERCEAIFDGALLGWNHEGTRKGFTKSGSVQAVVTQGGGRGGRGE